ncbi:hypothetical protein ACW23B_01855 [Streptomyces albidoflavus]
MLGKHPGRPMGYEVLRSSLPDDRASGYLWRAAATGAPEGRDPEGALPWRVFLAASDTRPTPACARVETGWDGTTDGTGAPAYTWQLALFDWPDVSDTALTWTGIDRALSALPADESGGEDPTAVTVPDTSAAELAALVDELGFPGPQGSPRCSSTTGRSPYTTSPALPLPDVAERVRVLDAICSLLPYACRSWLSAATWTGQAGHDLRLFFAPAVREGQSTAVYGGAPPPGPRGDAARGYLRRLLALQAAGDYRGLVRHLLAATGPATSAPEPYGTLKALREADLLDTVVEEIGAGAGKPAEAARVLQRHPAITSTTGGSASSPAICWHTSARPGPERSSPPSGRVGCAPSSWSRSSPPGTRHARSNGPGATWEPSTRRSSRTGPAPSPTCSTPCWTPRVRPGTGRARSSTWRRTSGDAPPTAPTASSSATRPSRGPGSATC